MHTFPSEQLLRAENAVASGEKTQVWFILRQMFPCEHSEAGLVAALSHAADEASEMKLCSIAERCHRLVVTLYSTTAVKAHEAALHSMMELAGLLRTQERYHDLDVHLDRCAVALRRIHAGISTQ
jgi:hypothetical protein